MKSITSILTTGAILATATVFAQDLEGEARQLVVADGKLYVGGAFEKADRKVANNVAVWDGSKWSTLGKGVDGYTSCIISSGNKVYVTGDFTMVNKSSTEPGMKSNRISFWDGTKWNSLGDPTVDRSINSVVADGSKIYVGGNFTKLGGTVESKCIGMYDGKKWAGVGGANFDRAILAMSKVGNDLYVGGIFQQIGDDPVARLAKWDGKAWSEVGNRGLDGSVETMTTDGTNLYVGGKFTADGSGNKLQHVAKWDGSKWDDLGGGVDGTVSGIFVDGDKVYVAGSFSGPNKKGKTKGPQMAGLAMWDGKSWTTFPEIPYVAAKTVAVYNGVLYVGGRFDGSGDQKYGGIAKFENNKWVKLTP